MLNKKKLPVFHLSGTPYEIGLAHGTLAHDNVLVTIDTYSKLFKAMSDIDWPDAQRMARQFIGRIEEYDPAYLEEIRGIADGAGVKFEEILALNVRSELAFQGKVPISDGCTSLGIAEERAMGGQCLMGQSWDWRRTLIDALVILNIHQLGDKPDIVMITEAGIIGKFGFNSAGVGICLNAMASNAVPMGLPLHIAMRGVLDSMSLSEAIGNATRMQLGCCANFMLQSEAGEILDLELDGQDFDVLYPTDGILVHTNHFLSPRLPRAPYIDTMKYKFPDTFIRLRRANKLLRRIQGPIGTAELEGVFADHCDFPAGICHHADPRIVEGKRMETVFSFIMNIGQKEIHICTGLACETAYEVYRF